MDTSVMVFHILLNDGWLLVGLVVDGITLGGLVPRVGSMGGLSTGLLVNHRPSQGHFMSISEMVVL
jgi:hypothetical protein